MSAKNLLFLVCAAWLLLAVQSPAVEVEFKDDRFTGKQTFLATGPDPAAGEIVIHRALIVVQKVDSPRVGISFERIGDLRWGDGNDFAIWLIDGERVQVGVEKTSREGSKPFEKEERAFMVIDAGTCAKILGAKTPELRIGLTDFPVTKEMLAPVQAVVDRYRAELARGALREYPAPKAKSKTAR